MSNQNVELSSAFQLQRKKRIMVLITTTHWSRIDKALRQQLTHRLWCLDKPIGYFQPYKVTVPFNNSGSGTRVKALSWGDSSVRIAFPNMDAENDPYYNHLTKAKDELIHSKSWDADDLLDSEEEGGEPSLSPEQIARNEQVKVAIRLYEPWNDEITRSYEEVAGALGEKSDTWVGNRVREWKAGEHRDLVPEPGEE
jgi:hypothetical protein